MPTRRLDEKSRLYKSLRDMIFWEAKGGHEPMNVEAYYGTDRPWHGALAVRVTRKGGKTNDFWVRSKELARNWSIYFDEMALPWQDGVAILDARDTGGVQWQTRAAKQASRSPVEVIEMEFGEWPPVLVDQKRKTKRIDYALVPEGGGESYGTFIQGALMKDSDVDALYYFNILETRRPQVIVRLTPMPKRNREIVLNFVRKMASDLESRFGVPMNITIRDFKSGKMKGSTNVRLTAMKNVPGKRLNDTRELVAATLINYADRIYPVMVPR